MITRKTRHTFASRVIRHGVPVHISIRAGACSSIAEASGHVHAVGRRECVWDKCLGDASRNITP